VLHPVLHVTAEDVEVVQVAETLAAELFGGL
jgi:hypothetical protein